MLEFRGRLKNLWKYGKKEFNENLNALYNNTIRPENFWGLMDEYCMLLQFQIDQQKELKELKSKTHKMIWHGQDDSFTFQELKKQEGRISATLELLPYVETILLREMDYKIALNSGRNNNMDKLYKEEEEHMMKNYYKRGIMDVFDVDEGTAQKLVDVGLYDIDFISRISPADLAGIIGSNEKVAKEIVEKAIEKSEERFRYMYQRCKIV